MIRVQELVGKSLTGAEGIEALALALNPTPAWVHVEAPTPDESRALQERLGVHELAIEDALTPSHPPKIEEFEHHLFVIAHTPERDAEHVTRKVAVFLNKGWVCTLLRAPLAAFAALEARVARDPSQHLRTPDRLAATVLDVLTDGFEHEIDGMRDRVSDLESRALRDPTPDTLEDILLVRADVDELERTLRAQRDVYGALLRTTLPVLSRKVLPYVRDVYDHVVRERDELDALRDACGRARDAHLAATNTRLNQTMRALTGMATIMLPLTLVTGVFGMNFEGIPGAKSPVAFWGTLFGMALLGTGMLWWFRRRRWL